MYQSRQRPEDISTGCIFAAIVVGAIMMPFVKCGQAIGCVSEDFGKTKIMVNDKGRECRMPVVSHCEEAGYHWNGQYKEDQ